ncbi:winged helix-turn-helix domain-containing protein [Piscinibacter gummiphilus]|uniref:Winged helix-turn-helix domain-containing protein n=1 Tax=Piscinibacter gummiphilus TaxID=946333 RepID=A0ABZ0CUF9_9BURK|nr:winged helix-turn-helix domain-containing protein [Piscinibacter gummiphilus]WOB08617.1 winged helix-turn-helix domain-containing protein [Piscinibacter gummiphilus]
MTDATTYRFGPCEIDEARRSLTAHGQEVKLQPRVFDVLCYLVRHRERVVPKDELLDALWPGVVVVDNALQRVVSLARGALAEVGLGDAVRTYPRHGYRFCYDDDCPADPAVSERLLAEASLADARAAAARSDWAAACEIYAALDAREPLSPDDVEEWGRAAICAGLGPSAGTALERAVAQRDAQGDALGAARSTLLLVQIRIDHKEGAMARGLLQRASRYLDGQTHSRERGHFAWMASRMAIGSGDPGTALAMADEACTLGRHLRDPDVECLGLVYRGHALMAQGDVVGGLAQHEEAAAVIRLGGVRSWVAGWALCSILYAARHRCDWLRAAQFADAFLDWSRASRMPAFPGTCRLHRAAVLGVQGELEQAGTEVRAAAALLAHAAPWAEGDAYCVLGDIQTSHGDFAGAEASFRQAHALGWDPQPGLARLHLLTGRAALARSGLERALEETDWTLRERRAHLLCLLVHAAVAMGDAARAREALQQLVADPEMLATEALKAMHCCAQAELGIHEGELKPAVARLRQAVRHWREVGSPVGEAETRLRLAECLLLDHDLLGAELELFAVESNFATMVAAHAPRLAALRQAVGPAACRPALSRSSGTRPPGSSSSR